MSSSRPELSFAELNLPLPLLETLSKVGYEKPSPIQQATIPVLLSGSDVIGMAQTGTGKTAAFALPILAQIDVSQLKTQALVLCPTRELAIQVAEAFQTYAAGMRGFHVLPVYGGQDMQRQLTGLRRGAHVVVGTPGRLLDHLNRKSMDLSQLRTLVLDEADEMLRMGFIDDVEAILEKTPGGRQVALFSATMPKPIRAVAEKYLRSPQEIRIASSITNNPDIEQFYWLVQGTNKLDALTRILEVEDFDGMIIFVRTKTSTVELADKLNARGFSAAPLNGDMNQAIRIRTVEQLKSGALDIVVATDVAARGLDVERISHVMNYDIPYDDEAYVHRIGRTGRAGRSGKAFLFVAPRERRLLQSIERTTGKKIAQMELPTRGELIMRRSAAFKEGIAQTVKQANLGFFRKLVDEMCQDHECSVEDVAAAMAYLLQKERPLEPSFSDIKPDTARPARASSDSRDRPARERPAHARPAGGEAIVSGAASERSRPARSRDDGDAGYGQDRPGREERKPRFQDDNEGRARPLREHPDVPMERYRIHVGHNDGVTPREIVGAIANEADMEGKYIGHIRIYDDYTTVDLPDGMPREVFEHLQKTRVCNKPLKIERFNEKGPRPSTGATRASDAPRPARDMAPDRKPTEKKAFEKKPFEKKSFEKKPFEKKHFEKKAFEKDSSGKKFDRKPFDKTASGKTAFASKGSSPARKPDPTPGADSVTPFVLKMDSPDESASSFDKSSVAKKPKKPKTKSPRVDKNKGKRRVPKARDADDLE